MASLTGPESKPSRLCLDRCFRPCEALDGEEIYRNGIFEFNITRRPVILLWERAQRSIQFPYGS